MLAGKLLELYLRSKNTAYEHKRESYVIFKLNLDQFISDELGVLALLLQTFVRLMARGERWMPRMDRIKKLEMAGKNSVQEIPEIQEYKYALFMQSSWGL